MISVGEHDWPEAPVKIEMFGGPQDGKMWEFKPGDPHFLKLAAGAKTHVYLLVGNMDDGFRFVYEGLKYVE